MKHKLLLITILAALTLTACNSEPEWIEYKSESESTNEETTVSEFPYIHVEDKPYSLNANNGISKLEYSDGYIYFYNGWTSAGNKGSNTLKKLDPQTGEITSVCPDPVCTHNSPECDLYGFSDINYIYENSVIFRRLYHYVIRDDEGYYVGKIDHSDYVRYDMETDEIQVYEDYGEELGFTEYLRQIYVDGYQFYYDYVYDEEDDTYYYKICRRDIETGEVKDMGIETTPGNITEDLIYTKDGRIYCTNGVDIYSFDLNGEDRRYHCQGDFGWNVYSDGTAIYYDVRREDDTFEIWKKDTLEAEGKSLGIICTRWKLTENYIYYTTDEEAVKNGTYTYANEREIRRCDHNGENGELVFTFEGEYEDVNTSDFIIIDNYLYTLYSTDSENEEDKRSDDNKGDFKIMRIDCTDGSVYIIEVPAE